MTTTALGTGMKSAEARPGWVHAAQPFINGGISGCIATTIIQPIDMVKVRIQLLSGQSGAKIGPLSIARNIIRNDGFLALYKGLDAGLLRQVTYTTARLGLFRVISTALQTPEEKALPLYKKAFAGLAAGGLGALIGSPADLSLIRLQGDNTLAPEFRRNYKGVFDAFARIIKEEGVLTLWRGATPTVARAMALNMGMLASFDQSKEILEARMGKSWSTVLIASAISGWFAVTFSLPFDYVKTQIQKMKADPSTGKMPFDGLMDCARKTLRRGGPFAFYSGYLTYYARIAPHAMITLVILDYLNKRAS